MSTHVEPRPVEVTAAPAPTAPRVRLELAPGTALRTESRARSAVSWLWPECGALSPIPALDGMRALAVLLVMLFHASNNQPEMLAAQQAAATSPLWYARTGVDMFFVLSGFLLFLPYAQ